MVFRMRFERAVPFENGFLGVGCSVLAGRGGGRWDAPSLTPGFDGVFCMFLRVFLHVLHVFHVLHAFLHVFCHFCMFFCHLTTK